MKIWLLCISLIGSGCIGHADDPPIQPGNGPPPPAQNVDMTGAGHALKHLPLVPSQADAAEGHPGW